MQRSATATTGGATAAIVLAAGKSTRMKSDRAKVLHEICGRTMLDYVLDAFRAAGVGRMLVVIGHDREAVKASVGAARDITFVEQNEQKGTGHAVLMARDALAGFKGTVLVIAGDMPLIRSETIVELLATHRREQAAASIATTVLDNPTGYGRIIRDAGGEFVGIVEDRDCTEAQRRICEVNPSYYCFECAAMFEALQRVRPDNAKGEYYVTDALRILRESGRRVVAQTRVPAIDATGINSRAELAEVAGFMQQRIQEQILGGGVTIESPSRTWIESQVSIGADSVIRPFSFIGRGARIGRRCTIGPFAMVPRDAEIDDGRAICGMDGGDAALAMIDSPPAMAVQGRARR